MLLTLASLLAERTTSSPEVCFAEVSIVQKKDFRMIDDVTSRADPLEITFEAYAMT